MEIKGKTLQEHIWNSMGDISEIPYSAWHWVKLFEHFKIPLNDEDYHGWVEELRKDGDL